MLVIVCIVVWYSIPWWGVDITIDHSTCIRYAMLGYAVVCYSMLVCCVALLCIALRCVALRWTAFVIFKASPTADNTYTTSQWDEKTFGWLSLQLHRGCCCLIVSCNLRLARKVSMRIFVGVRSCLRGLYCSLSRAAFAGFRQRLRHQCLLRCVVLLAPGGVTVIRQTPCVK